jgi:hypothetical protein
MLAIRRLVRFSRFIGHIKAHTELTATHYLGIFCYRLVRSAVQMMPLTKRRLAIGHHTSGGAITPCGS